MSSKQQREQRKALLLREIQQQRLDLIASRRDWLDATAPLDRGWQTFHMKTRGWSDIAYNIAVDLAGEVWELRGWDAVAC